MRRPSTRAVLVVGLLVTLLLAGVVSVHASGAPDGLERVAEDVGFADRAEEHAVADGPLADYEVGNGGTGVAGVVGVVVVLVLATGGAYALRRRGQG